MWIEGELAESEKDPVDAANEAKIAELREALAAKDIEIADLKAKLAPAAAEAPALKEATVDPARALKEATSLAREGLGLLRAPSATSGEAAAMAEARREAGAILAGPEAMASRALGLS